CRVGMEFGHAVRLVDSITTPGGARPNEDRAGHRGSLAWVIDGATDLYQDSVLPAERDVVWLVDFLSAQLSKRGEAGYRGAGSQLLAELAEAVCQEQVRHAFPAGRIPPACSLAIVVDQGDTYDVTRIGDATGIVSGTRLRREATDFF